MKTYIKDNRVSPLTAEQMSRARTVKFANLKPTRTLISLRIPAVTLENVRRLANRRGVPYQSLINDWLFERSRAEIAGASD